MIVLEKKTFEISNIQNVDELNALSLALNAKEQVSHMKIGKEHIVFNCIDIEALISLIQSINKEFVVKEVIDGQKRKYDYAQRKETKHYFMFKNMLNENDVYVLIDKIKEQLVYKLNFQKYNYELHRKSERCLIMSSRQIYPHNLLNTRGH